MFFVYYWTNILINYRSFIEKKNLFKQIQKHHTVKTNHFLAVRTESKTNIPDNFTVADIKSHK